MNFDRLSKVLNKAASQVDVDNSVSPCDCEMPDCMGGLLSAPYLFEDGDSGYCITHFREMSNICSTCSTQEERKNCQKMARNAYNACKSASRSCAKKKEDCSQPGGSSSSGTICACHEKTCSYFEYDAYTACGLTDKGYEEAMNKIREATTANRKGCAKALKLCRMRLTDVRK
jgi:hypothetical protein